MKSQVNILTVIALSILSCLACAETLELFTSTRNPEDSNWDLWQQNQDETIQEDAIYLGMFDGASSHSSDQPESPIDGYVDGMYSTMAMGPGGLMINQSMGVSGTNLSEFPNDQRNTRLSALFNITKIMELNSNPQDINECKFKWSIDYVMPWAGSTTYLQAPTALYVDIFAANKQNYWNATIDGNDFATTDINDLQDEFDPNGAGILYAERIVDIRVDDGPWGSGIQPLTNWYIEQNGVQFYEIDVTQEIKDLVESDPNKYSDPNTAFIGFTIRPSLNGESVYLSMDARDRTAQNPIPPTLEIDVLTYTGDFDADGMVNMKDFAIFARSWLSTPLNDNWNAKCNLDDISSPNSIDCFDLSVFCENWLEGTNN